MQNIAIMQCTYIAMHTLTIALNILALKIKIPHVANHKLVNFHVKTQVCQRFQ